MSGQINSKFPSGLGQGVPGGQPPSGLIGGGGGSNGSSGMIGSRDRGADRFVLREAFGNNWLLPKHGLSPLLFNGSKTTPFRRAYNAGDMAGTVNDAASSELPGSNQINGRAVSMLNNKSGGIHNDGAALFSGNQKFVYDGADYVRYKKLKAMNKTYNDSSFGGDQSNGSYVALKRVRH
jgi:hypothetical protein